MNNRTPISYDLSAEEYLRSAGVSNTMLGKMDPDNGGTPAHLKAYLEKPDKATLAQEIGTFIHEVTLLDKHPENIVIQPEGVKLNTKEGMILNNALPPAHLANRSRVGRGLRAHGQEGEWNMKVIVNRPTDIEVSAIRVVLPVRYEEEDIPNDFPLRKGEIWGPATIELDTGKIREWPQGKEGNIESMKVTDCGIYTLLGPNGEIIAERNDYVPHGVIPGEYGDYVCLKINTEGIVTNWPKNPDLSAFFNDCDS